MHGVHEVLAEFNTRFPGDSMLVGVQLPQVGTPEERIAPLVKTAERFLARRQAVAELYRQQPLPIAVVAHLLGRNLFDLWPTPFGPTATPVAVCAGNLGERHAALALMAQSERGCILEPYTLLTLHALGVLVPLERAFPRLAVVQSTLELIRHEIAEAQSQTAGYSTVGFENGRLVRYETSADEVARRVQRLEELQKWMVHHCEVVPAIPVQDFEPEIAEQFKEAFGEATYDTLLAANGAALLLVSDDWHLRNWAKLNFGIDGVWTQPILMHLRGRGELSFREYANAVIQLAQWRFQFTSISPDELWEAAKHEDWNPARVFRSVAETLKLRTSELSALLGVVVRFLRRIWSPHSGLTQFQMQRITSATLDGIDPGSASNGYVFLLSLEQYATAGHLPVDAYHAVVDYYRGHFLLSGAGGIWGSYQTSG